jgi:hypothetical protein
VGKPSAAAVEGEAVIASILAAALTAAASPPASPPDSDAPPPRIVEECPSAAPGDLVVCGRPGSRSPYRLPPQDDGWTPGGAVDSVSRERHRLLDQGAAGIGSCSTAGPGGSTGCDLIRWKEGYEQRAGAKPGDAGIFLRVGPIKRPAAGQ